MINSSKPTRRHRRHQIPARGGSNRLITASAPHRTAAPGGICRRFLGPIVVAGAMLSVGPVIDHAAAQSETQAESQAESESRAARRSADTGDDPANFPTPDPLDGDWRFDFNFEPPDQIAVPTLDGTRRAFWYMTYTVTNDTGAERIFLPEITIATDQGDIVTAGAEVPVAVFNAIKDREENPLLESAVSITGRILQGEDHARDGVAIWPVFEHDVDHMDIFVAGLSGETHVVRNPVTDEKVIMLRTLLIRCELPGTPPPGATEKVSDVSTQWVVR